MYDVWLHVHSVLETACEVVFPSYMTDVSKQLNLSPQPLREVFLMC